MNLKNLNIGTAPAAVTFTSTSSGVGLPEWKWSFGDSNWISTTNFNLKNPPHTYSIAGFYNSILTVSNAS